MSKIVLVFSGGQDSTTILGKALHDGHEVYPISFDYGQRHKIELTMAHCVVDSLIAKNHTLHPIRQVDITSFGQLVDSALTRPSMQVGQPHPLNEKVPSSFVPNRNAMLLTMAHAYAQHVGANEVWTGVCQTDYSGYPDCRKEFTSALEDTLNIGYLTAIDIITPLMWLTKAETWAMAAQYDVLHEVVEFSHTCYEGDHKTPHAWGYGCGVCPACKLRSAGFAEWQANKSFSGSRELGGFYDHGAMGEAP